MVQRQVKKDEKKRLASRPFAFGSLELSEYAEKGGGPADREASHDQPALSSASPRYKSEIVPKNGDSGGLNLMIISRFRDRKVKNNTL